MGLLSLLQRWTRGDFQPTLEEEIHVDVVEGLLAAVRRRRAETLVVWIESHCGDPGNEAADIEARAGTLEENARFDIETTPIALHSTSAPSFPVLHEASWTPTVERHARRAVGRFRAEYQQYRNNAISSDFTLRDGLARDIFGTSIADPTLPEYAVRDIMQARSFCFPTATLVARNTDDTRYQPCLLCKKARDTYAHRFMKCKELTGARHTMHDAIAAALTRELIAGITHQGQRSPTTTLYSNTRVDAIWTDCPADIGDFVPDGILLITPHPEAHERPKILIIELARCYTCEEHELNEVAAEKRNQYHILTVFLRSHPDFRDHVILSHQYIMSVLGAIPEAAWIAQLDELQLSPKQQRGLMEASMTACILAGHQLNNTVRSLTELARARGTNLKLQPPAGIG